MFVCPRFVRAERERERERERKKQNACVFCRLYPELFVLLLGLLLLLLFSFFFATEKRKDTLKFI